MKVLYVDDLKQNRDMIGDILQFSGYEPTMAAGGAEALKILHQQSIQLVIADWIMPELNGIELIQKIREEFTENYIYTILLSARGERADIIRALESGADDFMTRPFLPPELMARLAIGRRLISLQNSLQTQNLELAQAKQEWEATTDSISQLVCLIDADGTILRVNGTVERWGLCEAAAAAGQPLTDLLQSKFPEYAKQYAAEWSDARGALKSGQKYEFEGEDWQQDHFFVAQFEPINPFSTPDSDVPSFAAISIQDITERKKLELQLEAEHEKAENLLLNMLPRTVADRLKQGEETIADLYTNVTVMFTDLVDFTPMTANISPNELIDLLNSVFSAFDMLAERHKVEKIKTIGDAYMVVGGLPEPVEDHAERIANMALTMQRAVAQLNEAYNYGLRLRVGIHSGPVVAGVIGMKKLTYDLWGETVNTASRMESHGVVGCVHVSEATYQLLKDKFDFEPRGKIDVKSIGKVNTYLLKDAKATD